MIEIETVELDKDSHELGKASRLWQIIGQCLAWPIVILGMPVMILWAIFTGQTKFDISLRLW